jgi:hypothetical protein
MSQLHSQRHSEAVVLYEIDLGRHCLLLMSDRRIDLRCNLPTGAQYIIHLDPDETYRLLICLQEVFKQGTN